MKTIPAAIPVTITTIELVDDAPDQSSMDLLPLTALESVTPAKEDLWLIPLLLR